MVTIFIVFECHCFQALTQCHYPNYFFLSSRNTLTSSYRISTQVVGLFISLLLCCIITSVSKRLFNVIRCMCIFFLFYDVPVKLSNHCLSRLWMLKRLCLCVAAYDNVSLNFLFYIVFQSPFFQRYYQTSRLPYDWVKTAVNFSHFLELWIKSARYWHFA